MEDLRPGDYVVHENITAIGQIHVKLDLWKSKGLHRGIYFEDRLRRK